MPIIDFLNGYDSENPKNTVSTSIKLQALMHFPDDSLIRDHFYNIEIEKYRQKIARKVFGEPVANTTGDQEHDDHVSMISDAYRDTPFPNLIKRSHQGLMSGLRLHYVSVLANISNRGSFNAADFLINNNEWIDSSDKKIATSSNSVFYAWKIMKPVAHLWAAHNLYYDIYGHGDPTQDPEHLISLSEWYRNFGEQHIPTNTDTEKPKPVLSENESWTPPDSLNYAEHVQIPFNAYTELTKEQLENLEEEYRMDRLNFR